MQEEEEVEEDEEYEEGVEPAEEEVQPGMRSACAQHAPAVCQCAFACR